MTEISGFAGRRVRRSDLADHREIVNRAGAVAVENEQRMRNRRFVGGIVEAGNAAGSGLGFADQMRGGGGIGGDHDGACAQRFAAA